MAKRLIIVDSPPLDAGKRTLDKLCDTMFEQYPHGCKVEKVQQIVDNGKRKIVAHITYSASPFDLDWPERVLEAVWVKEPRKTVDIHR